MSLESRVQTAPRNLGRGFVAGAGIGADPVGAVISGLDYFLTGVGPADKERAMPTLTNRAYQWAYRPEDDVPFWRGYVPRAAGTVAGAAAVPVGIAAAGTALAGPAGGLAALVGAYAGSGIISLVRSGGRFGKQLISGEQHLDKPKAGFGESARYGWNRVMNVYYTDIAHVAEAGLTGRSIGQSGYKSTEQETGGAVRRNAGSYAGQAAGAGGAFLTLGGLALVGTAVAGPVGGLIFAGAIPGYNFAKGLVNTYRTKRAARQGRDAVPAAA